jgi:hypothetical protein
LSGSHMIMFRRTRSVSARSEDRVVLDGPAYAGPEIGPEGPIPFFSSPRLLRCQSHRFHPAFSALFSQHRGLFGPPFRVREAQYVKTPLPVKHEFPIRRQRTLKSLQFKRLRNQGQWDLDSGRMLPRSLGSAK